MTTKRLRSQLLRLDNDLYRIQEAIDSIVEGGNVMDWAKNVHKTPDALWRIRGRLRSLIVELDPEAELD